MTRKAGLATLQTNDPNSIELWHRAFHLGPHYVSEYTVSKLPDATQYKGCEINVTNESGGYVRAFSDGTNWRRVTDRAVVS